MSATGGASCPICASRAEVFLSRRSVPVHQNLLFGSRRQAREIARGELSLACCERCGFVFNAAFEPDRLSYGSTYDNTQVYSPAFLEHMRTLAETLIEDRGIAEGHVVEVGCGAGAFLRLLAEFGSPSFTGDGFDPAYRGPESELDGRLRFDTSFFDPGTETRPATAVISRHVIEHIAKPVQFLEAIRVAATRARAGARVYLETPSVEWIFRNGAIWDLFYEHCSYFSPESLRGACARAGLGVCSISQVFGGQYMWAKALPDPRASAEDAPGTLELVRGFTEQQERTEVRLKGLLGGEPRGGSTFLWGAGAKGVTVANLIDPDCRAIAGVIDINPQKQGKWLPGTGHPIVAPERLAQVEESRVIVTNSNYLDEIHSRIRSLGAAVELAALEDAPGGAHRGSVYDATRHAEHLRGHSDARPADVRPGGAEKPGGSGLR